MIEKKYNDIYKAITPEEMAQIPEAMKAVKRFICWGSDKVPVSVVKGPDGIHFGINVTDPENWGTFVDAAAAIGDECYVKGTDEYFHVVGIGFVVGDGWFCIDMDGGAAHKKETVPETALDDALNTIGTYAEKSLSGCGYHLFGRCDFSTKDAEHNKPHRGQDGKPVPESYEVEFFTRRKFIAITGRKVSGSGADATDCSAAALDFYTRYILNDWNKDEAERAAERAKVAAAAPINNDDAAELFRLNYPEILAVSDSSNFKRGGEGVKLAPGEYSWIGALKAMQEIGIPESAIIEWCRRGSNFKSEKDVQRVLNKSSKPGAASVAGIIKDAQAHGWKPDPDKLTGEAKRNHDRKIYYEEQERKFRETHREEHAAKLAAIGIDCGGNPYRFTWKYDFDGSIDEVVNLETGEIAYQKSDEERAAARAAGNSLRPDPEQPVPGKTVHTVPGAKEPEKKNMLTIVNYNDIVIKETDYLFFPWFPRGKLVAIQGDSGTSKSTVAYAIGALVTTGTDLLGIPCEDPGNVMFITNEDDESDILTAFLDAGGDMSRLFRIREREQIARLDLSPAGAAMINKIIKEQNIRFLVLDPIQAFLRGDMNKANETRPQLARLMDIAAENNNCIAFIEHTGKDTTKAALHRGIGSVDIGAATRSILQIVTDPSDDFYKIAYTVKNNTAAIQDTRRAIRYQVKDRPGSRDQVTGKHHHFHGHAEFSEILPEYNERTYRRAQRNAEENSLQAEIDYATDPLVITVRKLIEQNPGGLFIGTTELIRRITICAGHCPYVQTQNKHNGINSRISVLRGLMMENDAIQMDLEKDPTTTKPFYWDGQIIAPDKAKERGVYINPIRNSSSDSQQTKF